MTGGCLCGDGCISAYDNQPCDCFCDGDPDGKHHYDYLDAHTTEQEWGAPRSPVADAKLRHRMAAITRNLRGDYDRSVGPTLLRRLAICAGLTDTDAYDRSIERACLCMTFYDRMPRALRRLVPRRFV